MAVMGSSSMSRPRPLFIRYGAKSGGPYLPVLYGEEGQVLFSVQFQSEGRSLFWLSKVLGPMGLRFLPARLQRGGLLFIPRYLVTRGLRFSFTSGHNVGRGFLGSNVLQYHRRPLASFYTLLPPLLQEGPISLFLRPFAGFLFLVRVFLRSFPRVRLRSSYRCYWTSYTSLPLPGQRVPSTTIPIPSFLLHSVLLL